MQRKTSCQFGSWKRVFTTLYTSKTLEVRDYCVSRGLIGRFEYFPCLHTVIETRVEVWENEKLKCSLSNSPKLSPASVSNCM